MDVPCEVAAVRSPGALVFAGRFDARRVASPGDVICARRLFRRRTVFECETSGDGGGGGGDGDSGSHGDGGSGVGAVFFPLERVTAIMGPSGAGKTTLMRMVSGRTFGPGVRVDGLWFVRRPDVTARHDDPSLGADEEIGAVGERVGPGILRRQSAFVEQADAALDSGATPRQLVRFYVDALHRAGTTARERAAMTERALGDALLGGRAAGTPCGRLSGGQRKRTSIAVQLARDRPLVFLDEPTSGLDSASAERIFSALQRANRRRHTTVVAVVHHPSDRMFGRTHWLVLVAAGVVAYQGPPAGALPFLAARSLTVGKLPSHADAVEHTCDGTTPKESDIDREAEGRMHDSTTRSKDHAIKTFDDGDDGGDNNGDVNDDDDKDETQDGRDTVPGRIVACVAQAPGEDDTAYDERMRDIARVRPATLLACGDGEDDGPAREGDGTGSGGDCKSGGRGARHGGCLAGCWQRAVGTTLCLAALSWRRARRVATLAIWAQATFKYVGLPLLMVALLAETVRGGDQNAVVGVHAVASLAVMWTGLNAAWEVVALMPSLDAQYVKHREDGLYGAATHLASLHAADSAVRLPMLTAFSAVLYFGCGFRTDDGGAAFFQFWAVVLLMALLARSLCFACTCWLRPAHAVMALSLALAVAIVAGGVYMPLDIMPAYARDVAYASFMAYGVSIVARNEFAGRAFACGASCCAYPTGDAAVSAFAVEGVSVGACFAVLVASTAAANALAWLLLVLRARVWRRV